MTQGATVPLGESPLDAKFQHMDANEFDQVCRAYNRLWVQEGLFPQIEFPIPGPFKRFGPKMYICTSWPIGKTLLQVGKGTVTSAKRSRQVVLADRTFVLMPICTWNQLSRDVECSSMRNSFSCRARGPPHPQKGRSEKPGWVKIMSTRRRKTPRLKADACSWRHTAAPIGCLTASLSNIDCSIDIRAAAETALLAKEYTELGRDR